MGNPKKKHIRISKKGKQFLAGKGIGITKQPKVKSLFTLYQESNNVGEFVINIRKQYEVLKNY